MTQAEFWTQLSKTKNWTINTIIFGRAVITNSKCNVCPIAYLANKKKKKVKYFTSLDYEKAGKYLGLSDSFVEDVVIAVDDWTSNDKQRKIRRKLLKVCGLDKNV